MLHLLIFTILNITNTANQQLGCIYLMQQIPAFRYCPPLFSASSSSVLITIKATYLKLNIITIVLKFRVMQWIKNKIRRFSPQVLQQQLLMSTSEETLSTDISMLCRVHKVQMFQKTAPNSRHITSEVFYTPVLTGSLPAATRLDWQSVEQTWWHRKLPESLKAIIIASRNHSKRQFVGIFLTAGLEKLILLTMQLVILL